MAIFVTDCSICGKNFTQGDHIYSTSGVFFPGDHPLFRFCDSGMHWDCYAAWPYRRAFAAKYVQCQIESTEDNPYWFDLHLDKIHYIHVNPQPPIQAAVIWPWETGSRIEIDSESWQEFLRTSKVPRRQLHRIEEEVLKSILPLLRKNYPSWSDLLNALNTPKTALKLERLAANKQQLKAKNKIAQESHRIAKVERRTQSEALLLDINRLGFACPNCRHISKNWRYIESKKQPRFVCIKCGRSFVSAEMKINLK